MTCKLMKHSIFLPCDVPWVCFLIKEESEKKEEAKGKKEEERRRGRRRGTRRRGRRRRMGRRGMRSRKRRRSSRRSRSGSRGAQREFGDRLFSPTYPGPYTLLPSSEIPIPLKAQMCPPSTLAFTEAANFSPGLWSYGPHLFPL